MDIEKKIARLIFRSLSILVFLTSTHAVSASSTRFDWLTGDRETDFNWGVPSIRAQKAHEAGFTGKDVKVGVFDFGFDASHPDLIGRLGGYFNPYRNAEEAPRYIGAHGTSISGIISGNKDDSGVLGVAYDAELYVSSFDWRPGDPMVSAHANSYRYFVDQGVEIVNNSWELRDKSERGMAAFYQEVLPYARSGGVSVFASGNDYKNVPDYPTVPAGLPTHYPDLEETWLAVTALGPRDERGNYAQICGPAAQWCLAAPGGGKGDFDSCGNWVAVDGVTVAAPGGFYYNSSGTSFAAPMVTGALAIAREIYPDADMLDLRKLILQTTIDIGEPGIDRNFGWGKLDLGNVVDTISPYGRSIFAGAAYSRQIAMEQVSRLPFGPLVRSQRLKALWATVDLARSELAASEPVPGTRAGSRAFAAGMDLVQRGGLTAGAGIAYSFTSTSENSTANTASGNGFYGFGYADWSNGAWYAKGTAGLGSLRQKHTRRTIPGLSGTAMALDNPEATSATRGTGVFSNVEAGRTYHAAIADFTLFGRFFGSSQKMKGFSEDGLEIFGYRVEGERLTSAMAGPGLRVSRSFAKGDWTISPELELSYARAFGDTASTLNSSLLGRSMEARTAAPGRNVFGVGAKLSFNRPHRGFTASVSYKGSFRKNANQNSVQFGLSFAF